MFLELCPQTSNVLGVSKGACLQAQNMGSDTKLQNELLKEEKGEHEIYSHAIRYILLKSLDESSLCVGSAFFDKLRRGVFFETYLVTHMLSSFFFRKEFEEILERRFETNSECEIEDVKFLLSRCALLSPVPTYSNFVLVASFLTAAVRMDFNDFNCFDILYISEFCLSVLYRRRFWKIFQSPGDYWRLKIFCDEFLEKCQPTHSKLTELKKTSFGENWRNQIQSCMEDNNVSFPLEESEIEMFKNASLG
ncbi:hypothetical protein TNIN_78861 [Trichonephila inaurata madagascariensis]|uniref:Uncharacterized protein n=1 Tax=Trichonephila inaurata madagascariensis TaxID=2747483 RepID=A0A8X6X7D9_9ARAC|nr:hypothetical protein TNIN_78861 [Trichonephila inaurata madagascariensis]